MAIGFTKMYIDGNIINKLQETYGQGISRGATIFFETWRNYGLEKAKEGLRERTFYLYLEMLRDAGYIKKVKYGEYIIVEGYEQPIKI